MKRTQRHQAPAYAIQNSLDHANRVYVVWTDFWGGESSVYQAVVGGDRREAWRRAFSTAVLHGWTLPRWWQFWRRLDTTPPPGVDISKLKPPAVDPLSLHSWKRGTPRNQLERSARQ